MKFHIAIFVFILTTTVFAEEVNVDATKIAELRRLAGSGQTDKLRLMIENDFNGTIKEAPDIVIASRDGKVAAVLIEHGGNAKACNELGWNILMVGCANGDMELVKLALANKLDVNSKDLVGHVPLAFCAINSQPEIAQLLIRNGAYVNAQDSKGRSLLALAADAGNLDLIKILLQNAADPRLPDCEGKLPSDHAEKFDPKFIKKDTVDTIVSLLNEAVKSEPPPYQINNK